MSFHNLSGRHKKFAWCLGRDRRWRLENGIISLSNGTIEAVKFIPFEPVVTNDYFLLTSSNRKAPLIMSPFIEHVKRHLDNLVPPEWRY